MGDNFQLIDSDREFAELIERLRDAPRYAMDTEFHRERTYFPHVAVVQVADEHGICAGRRARGRSRALRPDPRGAGPGRDARRPSGHGGPGAGLRNDPLAV